MINIEKERVSKFIYTLGVHSFTANIAMMGGRHTDYLQNHFPLRDENNQVVKGENGLPLIDWNAGADHLYEQLFRGFDEELAIDGVVVNSRSPEGKRQIKSTFPAEFGAWVMQKARDKNEHYKAAVEAVEGLPPAPGGSTD